MLSRESDFVVFIGWLRTELGLNRTELAAAIGVPLASIQRWESGNYKPTPDAMMKLGLFCARLVQEGKLVLPKPAPWNRNISTTLISKPGFDSPRSIQPRKSPWDVLQRRRERLKEYREFLGLP